MKIIILTLNFGLAVIDLQRIFKTFTSDSEVRGSKEETSCQRTNKIGNFLWTNFLYLYPGGSPAWSSTTLRIKFDKSCTGCLGTDMKKKKASFTNRHFSRINHFFIPPVVKRLSSNLFLFCADSNILPLDIWTRPLVTLHCPPVSGLQYNTIFSVT